MIYKLGELLAWDACMHKLASDSLREVHQSKIVHQYILCAGVWSEAGEGSMLLRLQPPPRTLHACLPVRSPLQHIPVYCSVFICTLFSTPAPKFDPTNIDFFALTDHNSGATTVSAVLVVRKYKE